jgi:hypothetical protein
MLRAPTLAARAQMPRRLAHALALAAVLFSVPIAHAQSGWVMVPGAGVGRVTLGMRGPDLLAVLGAPKAYCWLSASADERQDVTVLYYSDRGLALTLSASRGTVPTVTRIHVVAGYSATLSDEVGTGVYGKAYRKCAPHGTLTLDVIPGSYVTSNGIRPGSSEREVAGKFGPPKAAYPAVASGDRLTTPGDVESLLLHRLLLLPYRAYILAYDGIVFGVYGGAVVAITIDWTGFDPRRYVAAHPSPGPGLRVADPPAVR